MAPRNDKVYCMINKHGLYHFHSELSVFEQTEYRYAALNAKLAHTLEDSIMISKLSAA